MLLLISDANILMDIEGGDLVAPMFSLGYQFAVPVGVGVNSPQVPAPAKLTYCCDTMAVA